MKRYTTVVMVLLAAMLISCGGGGGGDGGSGSGSTGSPGAGPATGGGTGSGAGTAVTRATPGMHVEETDAAVTLTGAWTPSDPQLGWSGGSAVQSTVAGARAAVSFTGTSVTWFGSRGQSMGIAKLSVDGGPAVTIDLYASPGQEVHSPAFTVNGLSDGPHTLTIEVTGDANHNARSNVVVVDAFDIQGLIVSHIQQTNPEVTFSAGWTDVDGPYSACCISNAPELPQAAKASSTTGAKATLPFRGTGVSWIGYRGPDAGIARVQIDGGAAVQVDTYGPTAKYQEVLFTASGLADTNHTLTIEATGGRNAQATNSMIVVDAFDIRTPGRRYQEWEPSIAYSGDWTPSAPGSTDCPSDPSPTAVPVCTAPRRNINRVWSEGAAATNNSGGRAVFSFTGTSVSWISSAKSSLGYANVYLDGVFQKQVALYRPYPIEAYQWEAFRADGLSNGPHTLTIEHATGNYIVVDAFDVHP